jgi:hypothetical protein
MAGEADTPREAVERLLRTLIDRGSAYDVAALDDLYHDELQIVRVGADGAVRVTDKAETLRFFRAMRESGSPPLSTAARIRVTEALADQAHALVLREMQTEGMPRRLVFSLECVHTAAGWKVRREVAVAQP